MKVWMKGLMAAGVLALAAPAMAQTGAQEQGSQDQMGQPQGMQQGAMNEPGTYPGVLKNVNSKSNKVTIEVPLAPGATILRDGQTASLKQLKSGDEVRASFDPQTHELIRIDAQSKANAKKMKKQGVQNQGMQQQGGTNY